MERRRALIAGGGIGGLAAALALRAAGWDVDVRERAPSLEPVGAGLALWANALRALDRLGVGARVRAAGVPNVAGHIYTAAGERLSAMASPELEARFGEIGIVVHRAELQDILLDELGRGAVTTGSALATFAQDDRQVVATMADGETVSADVLIGADGLHSAVRATLHGAAPPRYAGYTAWRAVLPFGTERLAPGESWGAGARFGRAPLAGGRAYVFATADAPAGQRGEGGEKAELRRIFAGWHEPITEIIESLQESAILRNDIVDRPPLRAWGQGSVTLLGDAAHPMTPNLGQGACQALEDAVVLARHLGAARDTRGVEAALRAFEAERIPRVNHIVRQSRQVGAVGQWRSPFAIRVRTLLARHVIPRMQGRQYERLFSFDG